MPSEIQEFLQQEIFNNTYQQYILAGITFILVIIASWVLKNLLLTRLRRFTKQTESKLDDLVVQVISTIGPLFYSVLAINLAARNLNLPDRFWVVLNGLTILILAFYVVGRIQAVLSYFIRNFLAKRKTEEGEQFDASLANFLSLITNTTLWLLAAIVILQNFNVNITGLIGGLGITGIAVAFALQNVLSDIFASFSIYFDRPFKLGDFIIVGEDMGVVQKIGIKSTRIRALSGELLVISNRELSQVRIQNFGIMERRRRQFRIGVEYQTSNEKLRKASSIIKEVIQSLEICEFERAVFEGFGDFSLNFLCSYYVNSPDFNAFMEINQKINLEIKEKFEQEGIQFAFPTQTVLLPKQS